MFSEHLCQTLVTPGSSHAPALCPAVQHAPPCRGPGYGVQALLCAARGACSLLGSSSGCQQPAARTRPARPRWALLSNSQTLFWPSGTSATCRAGFCRVLQGPACHPSQGGCTGLPLGSGALRACWVRLRVPGCRPCPSWHPARAGLGGALGSSRWGRWEKWGPPRDTWCVLLRSSRGQVAGWPMGSVQP